VTDGPIDVAAHDRGVQSRARLPAAVIYRVRPVALRRDRLVISLSNGIPLLGLMVALYIAFTNGVSRLDIGIFLVMYSISMTGMEVGFHRLFSHRSFEAATPIRIFLAIAGCTCTQGPVLSWVANHRMHHTHSDRDGDTHSPHIHSGRPLSLVSGLFHAQIGWLFRPERAVSGHYARDLLTDRTIRRIDSLYFLWVGVSVVVPAIAGGLLSQSWMGALTGFLWGGLARICLIQHFTYAINSIAHSMGSRPFKTQDRSTNNVLLALPTFGIGWHNNHHAFPFTAKNQFEWWQVDISWMIISTLGKLGWAWNIKVPTSAMLAAKSINGPSAGSPASTPDNLRKEPHDR
jgi:stearoyl-CoA desaturase (delta-9 desaturase)